MIETNARKSSPLLIGIAWLFVLLPTAWGLTHTVQSALKLFSAPSTSTVTPTR